MWKWHYLGVEIKSMNINLNEFEVLEFNLIPCVDLPQMRKRFPLLFKWDEFQHIETDRYHVDRVLKYMVALYDKRSPLLRSERHIGKRKDLAAQIADFPRKTNGSYHDTYKRIMMGEENAIQRMAVRLIIHQRDLKYSQYVQKCETYYQLFTLDLNNKIQGLETAKDITAVLREKDKIQDQMDGLIEQIDLLYDEIFLGDKTLSYFVHEDVELHLNDIPLGWPEIYALKAKEAKEKA